MILAVLTACTGGVEPADRSLLAVVRGRAEVTTTRDQQLVEVLLVGTRAEGTRWSIAAAGDRLAVGMPDADRVQLVEGISLSGTAGSRFGASVAWTERGLLVGAPDASSGTTSPEAGAAILFDEEEPQLILRGEAAFDHLGEVVAGCDQTLAVAAPWEQSGALLGGAVHLVGAAEGEVPVASVSERFSSPVEGARLGAALACRDGEVLAGAPFDDSDEDATGSVRALGGTLAVFGRSGQDYAGSDIAQGDLDGDGLDELAVAAFGAERVLIFAGDSLELGSRSPQHTFEGRGVAIGDLDGDGFDDLVTTGEVVAIWRGGSDPAWGREQLVDDADGTIESAGEVEVEDLDGDGLEDLLVLVER